MKTQVMPSTILKSTLAMETLIAVLILRRFSTGALETKLAGCAGIVTTPTIRLDPSKQIRKKTSTDE